MSMRHPKQARFQWFLLCQYLQTIFCWSRECRVKIWPVCWNKTLELSLSHRSQILHFHFLPSHKSAELTTMTASKVLSSKAKKFPPIIMKSRAQIVTLFSPVRLRNLKFCSSFSPPAFQSGRWLRDSCYARNPPKNAGQETGTPVWGLKKQW